MATETYLSESDRRKVCQYMRQVYRDQMRSSWMDSRLTTYIKREGLMVEHSWPGHTVTITDLGLEFLRENEAD